MPLDSANLGARAIAFYLPQFHPIPENDEFWGAGFTEWTHAKRAKPLFSGHYQPHVPAELGYYDLRDSKTREAQAQLAAAHGVEAFCYYHYWFAGRRVLERPFNEVLASGKPDFPFCLCWANQSWTGVWYGAPNKMLIEQTYPGMEDHRRHFETLRPAFADPRYVTVDGKPLFLLFSPTSLPDSRRVTDFWRELALKAGFPGLYLVGESWHAGWYPKPAGFDASMLVRLPHRRRQPVTWAQPIKKLRNKLDQLLGRPTVRRYDGYIDNGQVDETPGVESFPCVIPNWDNTPRSGGNGLVLRDSTPEAFRKVVRRALEQVRDVPRERRIVFVKSWNEWAEGNHLEPDLKFGLRYLEALRDELKSRA